VVRRFFFFCSRIASDSSGEADIGVDLMDAGERSSKMIHLSPFQVLGTGILEVGKSVSASGAMALTTCLDSTIVGDIPNEEASWEVDTAYTSRELGLRK
jgi:hypothetical protein